MQRPNFVFEEEPDVEEEPKISIILAEKGLYS